MAERLRLKGETRATAIVAKETGLTKRQVRYAQEMIQKRTEDKQNGGKRFAFLFLFIFKRNF